MRPKLYLTRIIISWFILIFSNMAFGDYQKLELHNHDPTRLEIAFLNMNKKISAFMEVVNSAKVDKVKLKYESVKVATAYAHLGEELQHFPEAVRLSNDEYKEFGKLLNNICSSCTPIADSKSAPKIPNSELAFEKLVAMREHLGIEEG